MCYITVLIFLSFQTFRDLTFMVNSVDGFKGPSNKDEYSHNFLYVGFLDKATANAHTKQGWKVDDNEITFTNCDKNPNSYYTFYPTLNYTSKPYGLGSRYPAGNKWRSIINAKDPVEEVSVIEISLICYWCVNYIFFLWNKYKS